MSENVVFPVIEAQGTSYEIGHTHGEKARTQILHCLETYHIMFSSYAGLNPSRAKQAALSYLEPIESYNPDYILEMRGIADGAGVDFEDILMLNARSELIFQSGSPDGGCTSIAATPEATSDSVTLLSQNWDWKMTQLKSMIVLKIKQEGGRPDITMVTEGGIIGKIGMNSAGLGVCLNALSCNEPANGLPIHIALRGILDSSHLHEAVSAASRAKLGCCANFLVAHSCGEALSIEVTKSDFDALYPQNGLLIHSNHFLSSRLPVPPLRDTSKFIFPDTFMREGRAKKLAGAAAPQIDEQTLMKIYRDHTDYPSSICRHERLSDPEDKRMGTVFSIVMNLTKNSFYLCGGQPCDGLYTLYSL